MITQMLARTLQQGDLVAIAYRNYLYPAIFAGEGRNGNVHIYRLTKNTNRRDYDIKRIKEGKKPYVDFINRKRENTIVKFNPNELDSEMREWYDEYKKLLFSVNAINNKI